MTLDFQMITKAVFEPKKYVERRLNFPAPHIIIYIGLSRRYPQWK